MKELSDTDIMPFGRYAGKTMQSVPASYFRWLWNAGKKNDVAKSDVADYIDRNMGALQKEGGAWDEGNNE